LLLGTLEGRPTPRSSIDLSPLLLEFLIRV
jgi:hypothetical protein